jgi:diguanylate cyclase (GGDEF)-like protein
MDEMNLASTKLKLVLIGFAVVGVSVTLSLLATHASFSLGGEVSYTSSMIAALIIPLLVAPPSYGYVAWLSWKLKNAHDRLDSLAHQDALTALHNRRAFVEEASRRIAGEGRHMMVMIDIDHFKKINDRLGHAGGDNALRHAADLLRRSAPQGALLARLGGEEFGLLLVLPPDEGGASLAAAEAHVEAMRLQLKSVPLITPQGMVYVTASFGLAVTRPGEPLDALLGRADKALYTAKDEGRDRLHAIL